MKNLILLYLLLISSLCLGQNYPIFTSLEITPPYSVKLHEYTTEQSHRLGIGILLKDVSKPSYKIKLKFKFESQGISIETSPSFMPQPIEISGGEYVKFYGYLPRGII